MATANVGPEPIKKQRGKLLTTWLVMMLVGGVATVLIYSLAPGLVPLPAAARATYIGLGIVGVVLTIFLFDWRKWAFFGYCGLAAVGTAVNISLGLGAASLVGLVGPLVVYLTLRPKWNLLR